MKLIVGFFMAWGNFITLPCPYKRWDNTLRSMMLAFLPAIGAVIGGLWIALAALVRWLALPVPLESLALMGYPFAVCGCMHLDGFMDCSDAILSRRPLEERQRILKDSHVGAFAVVSMAFLLLAWFAAMLSTAARLTWADLLVLPVMSRGISGLHVLWCRPMGHSQYALDEAQPGRWKYRAAVVLQLAVVLCAAAVGSGAVRHVLCLGAVMTAAGLLACLYARRQLGGMSGDVAGYTICVSELAGMLMIAVC